MEYTKAETKIVADFEKLEQSLSLFMLGIKKQKASGAKTHL